MKSFIKENGHLIWRLMLNQIGMTVFGLMMSMTGSAIDYALGEGDGTVSRTWNFWASVFSVVFYMFINYWAIKEEGQKDKIRVDAGRRERRVYKGVLVALCATSLNILLAIIMNICEPLASTSGLGIEIAGDIYVIAKWIAILIQGMYWGILLVASGASSIIAVPSWMFFLTPVLTLLVAHIAYVLGLRDFSLLRKIKNLFTPEEADADTKGAKK
ncbi:MAG: hypothetical protein LUI15_00215 [Firmicutes bacterium]|nr:hypothetical protein [Bacillota bacterium]